MEKDYNDDYYFEQEFAEQQDSVWEEAEKEPKILFKYKSLERKIDLDRLCQGLKDEYLYFPKVEELNDSLEGKGTRILIGSDDKYESEYVNDYRVLSLSETCFSPVLWSHYGNNRQGICLGFFKGNPLDNNNKSVFKKAKPVNYKKHNRSFSSEEKDAVEDDLMHKNEDWSYEKEWRIYDKDNNEKYSYNKEDLACIILGEKMLDSLKEMICNKVISVPVYNASYSAKDYCLIITRDDKSFNNEEDLYEDIVEFNKNKP